MSIRVWLVALFAVAAAAGTISTLAGATAGGTIVFGFHVHGKPDHVVVAHPNGTGRVSMRLPAPGCAGCLQVSSDGTTPLDRGVRRKADHDSCRETGRERLPDRFGFPARP